MTTIILILFSLGALILNLDAPKDLSSSSSFILFVEYMFTLCVSKFVINRLLKDYGVKVQYRYFNFFLIGLFVSLLLLAFSWTPFLSITNSNWGFDPQRYYYYACQIIEHEDSSFGLNYAGVVYFYVFIMRILGVDPLIPLFINSLLVLVAILLVTRLIVSVNKVFIVNFAWLFLIPEIIYFNIMPSREILCMTTVIFIIVTFVRYLEVKKRVYLVVLLFEFLFLFLIRPPFTFSLFLSIFIFLLFFSKRKIGLPSILLLVVFSVIVGGQLSTALGSMDNADNMQKSILEKVDGKKEMNADFKYSENSLAAKLIPDNAIEFVIFGIIRSFLYLFPSPSFISSLLNMKNAYGIGDAFVNMSSLIMMFLIPMAYVLLKNIKKEKNVIQIIGITFLIFWIVVGAFNTNLIHVRYRLVYDLLYFSLVIYFVSMTNKRRVKQLITYWSGILLLIVSLFFILRKII